MAPPLVLDIDGTITTPLGTIDSRVHDVLPDWDAPVVLATGKAFPFPVALCQFVGIPERIVAENGGIVLADEQVSVTGDRDRARSVIEEFEARGGDVGWGAADTTNRWRETEVAVSMTADETLLREVAAEYEMEVYDTGYAYHVKTPGVTKGEGITEVAEILGIDLSEFVAVGDSENDAPTFEVVGESYAVGNADDVARAAADHVLDDTFMDGTLTVLNSLE